jgi:hypothetical protein
MELAMDQGTQLTGPQALARLLQRVRSATPEELPEQIDRAGREVDLLFSRNYIDLPMAESARTDLRNRLDGIQGAVVEYPVSVVIEICLLNFDQLTAWEKVFIPDVKRFPWLSPRQRYRLGQAALKFGVRPSQ